MRILVVLPTRLGDAVLAGGALALLQDRYPEARFTLVANRLTAPLYGAMPRLDRIRLLEPMPSRRQRLTLWLRAAATSWSLVVDLRPTLFTSLLVKRQRLAVQTPDPACHPVVALADLLGLPPPEHLPLWLAEAHHKAATRLLPTDSLSNGGEGLPVLAVGPAGEDEAAIWPVERFAEAALALTSPDGPLPNARIAVVAEKHERVLANPLLARLPRERRLDWVGRAPLPVLAAALQHCGLYLGTASGLLHLATAAGCPTLALLGPAGGSSETSGVAPWGPETAELRAAKGETLADLDVGAVTDAAIQLLNGLQDLRQA